MIYADRQEVKRVEECLPDRVTTRYEYQMTEPEKVLREIAAAQIVDGISNASSHSHPLNQLRSTSLPRID
jgi:hypothetical protein